MAYSRDGGRIVSGSEEKTVRMWDADSGECLGIIEEPVDLPAIARGREACPWQAVARGHETVIEPARGGEPMAWFPVFLWFITTHPSGWELGRVVAQAPAHLSSSKASRIRCHRGGILNDDEHLPFLRPG